MQYFAGLDISMDETHICVLDREGAVQDTHIGMDAHYQQVADAALAQEAIDLRAIVGRMRGEYQGGEAALRRA